MTEKDQKNGSEDGDVARGDAAGPLTEHVHVAERAAGALAAHIDQIDELLSARTDRARELFHTALQEQRNDGGENSYRGTLNESELVRHTLLDLGEVMQDADLLHQYLRMTATAARLLQESLGKLDGAAPPDAATDEAASLDSAFLELCHSEPQRKTHARAFGVEYVPNRRSGIELF
ncbi:MAG: hypothetical protein AAF074_03660 [Pseudomonadota bacterium]